MLFTHKCRSASSTTKLELTCEPLEQRRMLAGNVTVEPAGSHLTIEGDDASNEIEISSSGNQLVISGSEGTTVNGQSEITVEIPRRDLRIDMQAGDDIVRILGTPLNRDIRFDGGDGRNTLETGFTTRARRIRFEGGADVDILRMSSTAVDRIDFRGGGGNDRAELRLMNVSDRVTFRDSEGIQGLELFEFSTDRIDLRGSTNVINSNDAFVDRVDIRSDGSSALFAEGGTMARINVRGGNSFSAVHLQSVSTSELRFSGTAEFDSIELADSNVGQARIRMGDGNDELRIEGGYTGDRLDIDMGDGDDVATILDEIAIAQGQIDGGNGLDTLFLFDPDLEPENFEEGAF